MISLGECHRDDRGCFSELAQIESTAGLAALYIDRNLLPPINRLQINYSFIRKGAIKAWHRHKHQDDIMIVLRGVGVVHTIDPDVTRAERFVLNGEGVPSAGVWIPRTYYHGISAIEDVHMIYFANNFYNRINPDDERHDLSFYWEILTERIGDDDSDEAYQFEEKINWGILNK